MLKEALQLLQETAREAVEPHVISDIKTDGRYTFVFNGKEIQRIDVPPATRCHAVHTLDDLIRYTLRVAPDSHPVVWHGERSVILVIDDQDRRDRVAFPLTRSEKFSVMVDLAEKKPHFNQADFIKLLRYRLGLDNTKVVSRFRKLQWQNSADASSHISHGDARLGKNITEKVQGVDELPEELDIPIPVYAQSGERDEYIVRCGIEIDARNQCFQLIPLPDELIRILDLSQASIRERLESALARGDVQVPIYYGSP